MGRRMSQSESGLSHWHSCGHQRLPPAAGLSEATWNTHKCHPKTRERGGLPTGCISHPHGQGWPSRLGLRVRQMAEKFRAERMAQGQPTFATPRSWLLQKGLLGKTELRSWEAGRERNLMQGFPCAHELHLLSPRA